MIVLLRKRLALGAVDPVEVGNPKRGRVRKWSPYRLAIWSHEISSLTDQGIVSATSFLTGVLVGRFGGAEELGLYMLGVTVALLATDLQISLISTPYMVYSPELTGGALRDFTGSSVLQQAMFAVVAGFIVMVIGWCIVLGRTEAELGYTFLVLSPALVASLGRDHVRRIEFARMRPRRALALDMVVAGVQLGFLVVVALSGHMTATWAFAGLGASTCAGWVGWLAVSRPTFTNAMARFVPDLSQSWKLGRWLLASGAVWAMATRFYPWMLAYFHGTGATGVWAACLGVLAFIRTPLTGLQNAIGPKLAFTKAKMGARALSRQAHRYSLALGFGIAVVALAYLGGGNRLIVLVYGVQFRGTGDAVFILALGIAANAASFPYSRALFVLNRASVDFAVNLLPVGVLVTAGVALTKSFGVVGAAWGLLIGTFVAAVVRGVIFTAQANRRVALES